ncbi:MAG: hypothetical protein M3Y27_28875 [Acidobacteriota bacterium]|nr:hypothetical protein [Acidobacteriota bacterium]
MEAIGIHDVDGQAIVIGSVGNGVVVGAGDPLRLGLQRIVIVVAAIDRGTPVAGTGLLNCVFMLGSLGF